MESKAKKDYRKTLKKLGRSKKDLYKQNDDPVSSDHQHPSAKDDPKDDDKTGIHGREEDVSLAVELEQLKSSRESQSQSKKKTKENFLKKDIMKRKQIKRQQELEQKNSEEEIVKRQEELTNKLKKRQRQSKKLGARTKRGQPVMKNQVNYLLNKIKQSMD